MKAGRVGKSEMNTFIELLACALERRPGKSCGVVICPHLVSEKVGFGTRGEIRRVEDKLEARAIRSCPFVIRCTEPPSNKKVPMVFQAWVCMCDVGSDQNGFRECQLASDRQRSWESQVRTSSSFVVCSLSYIIYSLSTPGNIYIYDI